MEYWLLLPSEKTELNKLMNISSKGMSFDYRYGKIKGANSQMALCKERSSTKQIEFENMNRKRQTD
jgi:hypothetical protein